MGSGFVDGLKFRSTSTHPATAAHSRSLSHHRPCVSTVIAMSIAAAPTQPVTCVATVLQPTSHAIT